MEDYFLFPAIHWGPKSQSLPKIADELNINVDTFAVIDDSAFERAEISSSLPQVRVYDVAEVKDLLRRVEFDVPITEMNKVRRLSYLTESKRKIIAASWHGDYEDFLRSCEMVMRVHPPRESQKARCLELLQRSNQFNLSGHRYSEEEFWTLLGDSAYECLAFEMADRFGDYGTVGFAAVELSTVPTLIDFVMSCRVAQKRVEETFLLWYAARSLKAGCTSFQIHLRVTDRNKPLRDVLGRLPVRLVQESGTQQTLQLTEHQSISVPHTIRIEEL